jgi:hypothetical protein
MPASVSVQARGEKLWFDRATPRIRSARAWWAWAILAALLLAGAVLLIYESRGTTFWADEWQWILQRRGSSLGSYLNPHNEHLSLVPVVIYKVLFATVGLHHYWPYRAVVIAAHLACVLLVFVYSRSRVGAYLAFVAAAVILFFGPGWQDILWPFQLAWLIAIGAGVGALLLLDRRDRIGDAGACVLLGASLASAGPGLAVAVGLFVELLVRRRWTQLWVVVAPAALYALWWIVYEQSHLSRHAITLLPRFVFDAAAGVTSSLAGLSGMDVSSNGGDFLSWGAPLLAIGAVAMIWRLYRLEEIPPRVLTLLSMALAFWFITGLGRAYVSLGPIVLAGRGFESRYLYIGAVVVVLLVVELARGAAIPLTPKVLVGIFALAAIVSNLGTLRDASHLLRGAATSTKAELGTLDITRQEVNPAFRSGGFVFGLLQAGPYFAAERRLGSVAASPARIAGDPESVRAAADLQLMQIDRPSLRPAPPAAHRAAASPPVLDGVQSGTVLRAGPCVRFRPAAFTSVLSSNSFEVTVPPGGVVLADQGSAATISLRRFAAKFQAFGMLAAGASALLRITPDLAPQPWHIQITSSSATTACALA